MLNEGLLIDTTLNPVKSYWTILLSLWIRSCAEEENAETKIRRGVVKKNGKGRKKSRNITKTYILPTFCLRVGQKNGHQKAETFTAHSDGSNGVGCVFLQTSVFQVLYITYYDCSSLSSFTPLQNNCIIDLVTVHTAEKVGTGWQLMPNQTEAGTCSSKALSKFYFCTIWMNYQLKVIATCITVSRRPF